MVYCPNCSAKLLAAAKFCHQCGHSLLVAEEIEKKETPMSRELVYLYTPKDKKELKEEVKADFFKALKKRVEEEQRSELYPDYVDRFYKAKFMEILDNRSELLAEEMKKIQARNKYPEHEFGALVQETFDHLLDYLMTIYCADINVNPYPEAILKYSDTSKKPDIQTIIFDYLDLDGETEKVFTDFITMPTYKLRNAADSFLRATMEEKLFFIIDQTLLGSCKEGVAMTNKGLYWKVHFEKPNCILFEDIRSIRREKDWLIINNAYFNVNTTFNIRLMKLLRKIKIVWG